MTTGSNFLNEHIIEKSAGPLCHYRQRRYFPPTWSQAQAEVLYLIRAPEMADAQQIYARIEKIAQGAALMTETSVICRFEKGLLQLFTKSHAGGGDVSGRFATTARRHGARKIARLPTKFVQR
ncbi:Aminobenzoyl-glutamate utilization protein B [Raoultella planticola]|uniref:Aminobenzoyl-glutamate utilization protein B n=1 Tax=Raoultella planticola TaxID=575 RepID=A0A485AAQ9_RAOPL|nr:Aminobenzoyl-glutamate utilization protein B [Raoultella planticola]